MLRHNYQRKSYRHILSAMHSYLDTRYKCDAASFLNPKDEISPAQQFLRIIKHIADGNVIPLSCWQLATYHDYIIDWHRETKLRELSATLKINKMSIAEINDICITKLKCEKLHKIIRLACELQQLQVSKQTFDLLRKGNWKNVDHLQFFVAMLQGFWGKNSFDHLIEYATYHLMKVMKLRDQNSLHKYQFCCVLFSPDSYIKIRDDDIEYEV